MELRPVRIFALGIMGLAVAFLFSSVQQYVLVALAITPLALLLVGQVYLPRSQRSIQVWFNPIFIELEGELISPELGTPLARLSGKEIGYSYFKQWHDFEIVTQRFLILASIGLLSLGGLWLAWWLKDGLFGTVQYFYVTTSVWVVVVLAALQWVWERRMLRLRGVSIGSFSVFANPKPPYRQVRYHFVDPEGHFRGGCFDSMYCSQADDMTIIFYDEADPERSIPAAALLFHKLIWKEKTPG